MSASYLGTLKKRPELFFQIAIVLGYFLWAYAFTPERNLESGLTPPLPENQYYNQLAQGFMEGHLYLRRTVPSKLLLLNDPYNPKTNLEFRVRSSYLDEKSIHDLTYYRGRFYLYFSAVPVIILFLPFALLTGAYLDQGIACAIFCSAGFIAQCLLLYKLQKLTVAKASPLKLAWLFFALGLMNLCPLLLRRAAVWEVPIAAGYAFESAAIYLAAKLYFAGKTSNENTFLLGLSIALGIVCRPTLVPFSLICGVPLLKASRESSAHFVRALINLAIPACAIAFAAIWYNYSRFGSALELGHKYQLSGDPGTRVTFSVHNLPFGLENYLLVGRGLITHFPYLTTSAPSWFPAGYLGVERPVGLLICLPAISVGIPLLILSAKPKRVRMFLLSIGIVAGLNLILLSAFMGACLRYEIEFAPVFAFLGIFGLLLTFGANRGKYYRLIDFAAMLSLVITIIFVLLEINTRLDFFRNPAMYT